MRLINHNNFLLLSSCLSSYPSVHMLLMWLPQDFSLNLLRKSYFFKTGQKCWALYMKTRYAFILLTATTNRHIWGYPFLQARWSKAFRIAVKVWNILYFNYNTKDNTLLHFHGNALKIYYTVNSNIIDSTWHTLHCCVHCKLKTAMYLVKQ